MSETEDARACAALARENSRRARNAYRFALIAVAVNCVNLGFLLGFVAGPEWFGLQVWACALVAAVFVAVAVLVLSPLASPASPAFVRPLRRSR